MGILQCDDGNLEDGDGCNSKCEVEPAFECFGGNSQGPDKCKNVIPLKVTFTATKERKLILEFDRPVIIPVNCKILKNIIIADQFNSTIKIKLENANPNCQMNWNLMNYFTQDSIILSAKFAISVKCTLSGLEIFVLSFDYPNQITDPWGNKLQQKRLETKAFKYYYYPEDESKAVEGVGTTFSLSSTLILIIVALAVVFQYKIF